MKYDPILCMMVDDSVKTQDELSLSQKKQVVTELKGYLKKSYNFSDESEYARAYEDLYHMFTTGSRKSISGLFENAVKKTGSHDSVKTKDESFIIEAKKEGHPYKAIVNGEEKELVKYYTHKGFTDIKLTKTKGKDSNTIDNAIRSCDRVIVKYDDAIGDTHTFFKESEEEAKKWIDQGKFPHGAAFNVKIDGKLYKKEAR